MSANSRAAARNIRSSSLSAVSGAGRKAELDYLFVECNESARPYGIPKHRHLSEIEQELSLAAGTLQARAILARLAPAVLIGFGGYPSVAPVLAARLGPSIGCKKKCRKGSVSKSAGSAPVCG